MKYPSEALSPPHEAPTTDQEDTLSDLIEIIQMLNIDSVPSQKCPPKCLSKKLESAHTDEVVKTRTRSSAM